ncbi:MAG: hypothetical protein GY786_21975 [Proteobacteria bacterium]|nr:hypothetical protein [Pseudomonadota bacterium]
MAQETVTRRVRNPADINYTQRMENAKSEYRWGQTYFKSYLKTKELAYLRLSAAHSTDSITQFYRTEALLAKTTKFYYEAKYNRLNVCSYYKTIQKKSFELTKENFINDINPQLCTR